MKKYLPPRRRTSFIIPLLVGFSSTIGAQISFSLSPTSCQTETLSLTANSGTITVTSYSWSSIPSGINFSAQSSQTTNIIFTSAGNYSIILTANSGTNTYSVQNQITVNSSPTINLAQSSLTTCVIYNPSFTNYVILTANGGQSYTWTPAPAPIAGNPNGPSNMVRPQTTSCFTVVGSNSVGCTASAIACVTVIPRYSITVSPASTVMCAAIQGLFTMVTLTAQPQSSVGFTTPYHFEWSSAGTLSPTLGIIPTWVETATHTVEMVDANMCRSLPITATVTADNCTSINELEESLTMLYPNPANNKLIFVNSIFLDLIEITNSTGQRVFKLENPGGSQEIDVSYLPAGIYFIEAQNRQGRFSKKFIKQ